MTSSYHAAILKTNIDAEYVGNLSRYMNSHNTVMMLRYLNTGLLIIRVNPIWMLS
jgi:hypothetical protein